MILSGQTMRRRVAGNCRPCERDHVIKTFLVFLLSSVAAGVGSVGADVFDLREIVVGTLGGVSGMGIVGSADVPDRDACAARGSNSRQVSFGSLAPFRYSGGQRFS